MTPPPARSTSRTSWPRSTSSSSDDWKKRSDESAFRTKTTWSGRVGALSAWVYWKNGNLNIGYSLLLAAGLLVGAYLGARLVEPVSDLTLRRMFGGFMLVVSIKMLWSK